jgi:CBF/Mak21 family
MDWAGGAMKWRRGGFEVNTPLSSSSSLHYDFPCRLLMRHMKLRGMLDSEAFGTFGHGGYNPFAADPENAGALQSTLWELAVLQKHFHPHVVGVAAAMAKIPIDGGTGSWSAPVSAGNDAAQVAGMYSFQTTGLFRPSRDPPPRGKRGTGMLKGLPTHQYECAARGYLSVGATSAMEDEESSACKLIAPELGLIFRWVLARASLRSNAGTLPCCACSQGVISDVTKNSGAMMRQSHANLWLCALARLWSGPRIEEVIVTLMRHIKVIVQNTACQSTWI